MLLNLVVVDGVLFVIRSFSVCLSDTGAWALDFCCYQESHGVLTKRTSCAIHAFLFYDQKLFLINLVLAAIICLK
jgi:hypothetical protein